MFVSIFANTRKNNNQLEGLLLLVLLSFRPTRSKLKRLFVHGITSVGFMFHQTFSFRFYFVHIQTLNTMNVVLVLMYMPCVRRVFMLRSAEIRSGEQNRREESSINCVCVCVKSGVTTYN